MCLLLFKPECDYEHRLQNKNKGSGTGQKQRIGLGWDNNYTPHMSASACSSFPMISCVHTLAVLQSVMHKPCFKMNVLFIVGMGVNLVLQYWQVHYLKHRYACMCDHQCKLKKNNG